MDQGVLIYDDTNRLGTNARNLEEISEPEV